MVRVRCIKKLIVEELESRCERPPVLFRRELIVCRGANVSETKWSNSRLVAFLFSATILLCGFSAAVSAQQSSNANPLSGKSDSQQTTASAPQAQATPQSNSEDSTTKHKSPVDETVGVLTRRSIFFPDLATDRRPLTSTQKFKLFVDKTIAPSTWVSAAASSGEKQALNTYAGYGQGWEGYGKRYGAAIANSASTNFFGTFVFPSLFHQDPRHFFYNRPGVWKKVEYAVTRQVVTRKDDGRNTFNFSRVLSVFVAEGIANSYLPPEERTVGKTFERAGDRFAWGVGSTLIKEFWPVIFKKLRPGHDNPIDNWNFGIDSASVAGRPAGQN
jgi:hypothetical protein